MVTRLAISRFPILVCVIFISEMDAFRIVAVMALVLCYGDVTNQLLEEDKDNMETIISTTSAATSTEENVTDEGTTSAVDIGIQPCVTGKGSTGECVKRQRCDYGTPAIDFTLYQPRGYINVCEKDEVCCPPSAQSTKLTETWEDRMSFDFDDDK